MKKIILFCIMALFTLTVVGCDNRKESFQERLKRTEKEMTSTDRGHGF